MAPNAHSDDSMVRLDASNDTDGSSARTSPIWKLLTPWFFVVWTLLAIAAVWWLVTARPLESGIVFSYDGAGGKPWSMRLREWLSLALLNFHWAIGWLLLAPYVFWVASRFYLEKDRWLTRVPILI